MTRLDKDALRGRWQDILMSLGLPASFLKKKHGPCPFCGGKDRYRFTDRNGDGGWICNQCGSGDGIALAMQYLNIDFIELKNRILPLIGTAKVRKIASEIPEWKRVKERRELWRHTKPIQDGDPVDLYLTKRLGRRIRSSELRSLICDTGAVMVARVLNGDGSRVATLHRTFLTKDGDKTERKITSGKVDGESVAVRLSPAGETLGIAEGIETALSASYLFGVPVWAALNEGFLRKWVPPQQVNRVIVFGDNDISFCGQNAAYECAKRCVKEGKTTEVKVPDTSGDDWNDVLLKSAPLKSAAA